MVYYIEKHPMKREFQIVLGITTIDTSIECSFGSFHKSWGAYYMHTDVMIRAR